MSTAPRNVVSEEVDILLINPPFFQTPADQSYSYYYPPLGLLYVAAVLKQRGYSVKIYNPVFEDKYISMEIDGFPPLTDESRRAFKERFIGYPDAPEWKQMISDLGAIKPKVVGFTMMTPQLDLSVYMARVVKEQNPGIPVIVGGVHPSALPETTAAIKEFDVLVCGEGEETALDLMDVYVNKTKKLEDVGGIYYKKEDGKIARTPSRPLIEAVDKLPMPLPDPVYETHPRRAILTSRGCYFRCTFCSQSSILGRNVRFRSPENVVDEIEFWYRKGIKQFIMQDSTFTADIKRAVAIMDLIIQRGLKISWGFQTRVDLLPMELLRKAKQSGCDYTWLGVESGHKDVLRAIKKGITLDQVKNSVVLIKEAGIEPYVYFILGFVEDTMETMKATQAFAEELGCYQTSFFMLTPFPGSETFNKLMAEKRLLTDDYFFYFWLYPHLIIRTNPTNKEVWDYYQEVKQFWANKKRSDIRSRSLQPSFLWKKFKENFHSPRAMARLIRKFVDVHINPKN
ncbi:MAG: B12-binding domain-containing radical SAM protein [Deltaproteobacteria bacterium]|nr:B12-binding domain-containing radical SAM protein [Deltaproteobacteria bacterium]